MTRRFVGPSASRPMAGVASAPVINAAVSSHSAVLSETPSARAMVGIKGAPRLLTMATRAATVTRVGMVARLRQSVRTVGDDRMVAVIESSSDNVIH